MTMEILRVENFRKKFNQTEVLKGINFTLQEGQILVIIGSSGSGKTTLLRCLNYLETPDEGKVYLNGALLSDAAEAYSDAALREKRLKFGLVFQNFNLFPHYRAEKNVSLAADLLAKEQARAFCRRRKAELKEEEALSYFCRARRAKAEANACYRSLLERNRIRAGELLERVGLAEKRESYPFELSGGQQQRVAIARALALEPAVLCFDEPTSALDPELTGEVLKVIRSLKGRTMIVVTHEMEFAREVADYVLFMADGVVEEEGTPEAVFGSPKSEKMRAFLKKREEN